MNIRTINKTRQVPRTIDGITHHITEQYTERVPRTPRDWDATAVRGAAGLVLALTGIAVVWSTVSIGSLLSGGVGYAAAALFDVAWAVTILLEWLGRYDSKKRAFARKMGWLLLIVTMSAIAWHGVLLGSVALAVVGAMVSFVAKVLWMGVLRHIDRELSPADRQWVEQEMSKAGAKEAIAQVRRRAARAETRATMELMAAEHELSEVRRLTGQQIDLDIRPDTASISAGDNAGDNASIAAGTDTTPAAHVSDTCEECEKSHPYHSSPYGLKTGQEIAAELMEESRKTEPERVPDQRPRSVRSAVAQLYADGVRDPRDVATRIGHAFGPGVASPDTVARYVRELKAEHVRAYESGGYL